MLRVAVDVGDVAGEAKARLLLALSLYETEEFDEATAHLICLLELGRVLELGEFGLRATALLGMMPAKNPVLESRQALAASMWA